jgi:hypothetical protein
VSAAVVEESDVVAGDQGVRSTRAARLALLAEQRAAERTRELVDLQLTRPELVSAYAPAAFAADALRWTV